ncbi:hypothetical protein AVEN_78401-1 [Araneus ventricosus]|uniref:Uncharacterized protein n=1 Tax=Araneus ventricosus TaxID=182803 RepID=A0A4Y1ZNB3_ARAVE|nr:hypothetical protein AVEN_78401-1 [Araneus ventricosus]
MQRRQGNPQETALPGFQQMSQATVINYLSAHSPSEQDKRSGWRMCFIASHRAHCDQIEPAAETYVILSLCNVTSQFHNWGRNLEKVIHNSFLVCEVYKAKQLSSFDLDSLMNLRALKAPTKNIFRIMHANSLPLQLKDLGG